MKKKDIKKWDGMPVEAIVCIRVRSAGVVMAGSSIEHCQTCGEEVWFAPTSIEVLEKYPTTPLLCMHCTLARVTDDDRFQHNV